MQKETDYNNQPDDFSKSIREKLGDYTMPVADHCWDEIEEKMARRKVSPFLRIGASVAAIVAILLLFFYQSSSFTEKSGVIVEMANETILTKPSLGKTDKLPQKENLSKDNNLLVNRKISTPEKIEKQESSESDYKYAELEFLASTVDSLNSVQKESVSTYAEHSNIDSIPSLQSNGLDVHLENEWKKSLLTGNSKNDNNWTLAASFGTSGPSSLNGVTDKYVNEDDWNSNIPGYPNLESGYPGELANSKISDIDYLPPLSFGLMVRRSLNKRIAIESGIVYTFLSTKFKGMSDMPFDAKLELHYLGIPVNVVANIWSNNRWNIYLSAGGMIEKGLKSNFTQNTYKLGQPQTTKIASDIKRIQLSTNAYAGVSYSFYKSWGLYLEPKMSYYFDNRQPISVRTENSFVFGLNAGVRYEF